MRQDFQILLALVDQHPPRSVGRLHTKSKKAQERLEQHHRRHGQRGDDNHRAHHIGDQMAQDDPAVRIAEQHRSLDKLLLLKSDHAGAHDPRHR